VSSSLLYTLSIAFSYAKYFKAGLNFVCVWTGHTPFHYKEFILPGSLGGQLHCFYARSALALWERLSLRPSKLSLPVFPTGMYYPPSTKVHQLISLVQPLFLVYRLLLASKALLTWYKQICIQTYMPHTHFSQTNQVCTVGAHLV